eukprot:m.216045 g.216045  ORF g.216045 m.216045 type:complete len:375 (+) comp33202_c5_seq2:146-1270(+)
MAATKRILIVGAGITGSTLSKLIRDHSIFKSGLVTIEVWDKSRGAGGRASTSRFDSGTADLGLQYLSTERDPLRVYYKDMQTKKVVAPLTARLGGHNPKYMDPNLLHFASVDGASQLCKHMLTGLTPKYLQEVSNLSIVDVIGNEDKQMWRATTTDGKFSDFDGVVLTPPVPQILAFKGDVQARLNANEQLLKKLQNVSYSARWVVAIKFGVAAWEEVSKLDWDATYIGKDLSDSICYFSIDQLKRGKSLSDLKEQGEGPVLVMHAGVPWSIKTGAATPKPDEAVDLRQNIESELMKEATRLLPGLLQQSTEQIKLHKWRYSQVYKGLQGGTGSEIVCETPLLVIAGDGLTAGSGFDHCTESAEKALSNIISHI